MNMNNLRIFIKVAEKLNITEAAKELYISQPAVSKALKNLESSLNILLLARDKHKGLVLTEAGKEILLLAREMTAIESKIQQVADRENKLLRGKVKVGSFPAASTKLLPEVIALFRSKYPLVRIELTEGTSNQIKEWVADRTVDIGIVASPFDDFENMSLVQDHMVAIIPRHHQLKDAERIDIEQYLDELIFCKGGHETSLSLILLEHHIPLHENLTVQTAETLVQLVKKNLGIGIISKFTLSTVSHDFLVKDLYPAVTREIGVIAHSFAESAPAAKEFIRIMSELSRSSLTNS